VGRTQISRVKIWAPWAKGAQSGYEKVNVFGKEYNEVAVLCNATDRHEISAKTSIGVLYRILIKKNFEKFPLMGDFALKPPFSDVLTGLRITRLEVTGYVTKLR